MLRTTFMDHGRGGAPDCLYLAEREMAAPEGRQVLIEVAYAGVNRPDVLQRSGLYPPPLSASPYLGLEVSGTVVAFGPQASRWKVGDQVCAHTSKIVSCVLNAFLADGNRHILILHDCVCACRFFQKNLVVFFTVFIKAVAFHRDKNIILKVQSV